MNTLAIELNRVLDKSPVGVLLSALGRRLFFPKGIIAQAAEAKKTATVNATLGTAFKDGKPLTFSSLLKQLPSLTPEEAVLYAPTAGVEALRKAWKAALIRKNPSLAEKDCTLPIVVPGITAGISYIADLFLDEGQTMIAAEPCWDNYSLIFEERRGAVLHSVPLFTAAGALNTAGFVDAIKQQAATGAVRLILNFPNNPSGYTPLKAEADTLIAAIKECAEGGASVLVICDDAYFGLFYEDVTINESMFARLATLHENVLAVKTDGLIKEEYAWGLRTAFVSFGYKNMDAQVADALEKKCMGAIRSSVSCANTPSQYLALRTLDDPLTAEDKAVFYTLLRKRYCMVKQFLAENPLPPVLEALPFNSGYFMSFRCKTGNMPGGAEKLRQALLAKGIGTIALGDEFLRVTFAAVEEEAIADLYRTICETAAAVL